MKLALGYCAFGSQYSAHHFGLLLRTKGIFEQASRFLPPFTENITK